MRHIKEYYSNKVNQLGILRLDKEFILETSAVGESKIYLTEIKELHETGQHFFVKISTGESLVLPKTQVDTQLLKEQLFKLLPEHKVIVKEDLQWKWF
ncbi:YcxB family protein [Desertivirga xinjiangensis]|uniref:YcxB family protein n=1 Tax=Desertivirga xinjiangensis TaxID=539206 RepID=UPI0021094AEC|nr:YcxB family protein [Pedobacter xinjiangensis]